MAVRPEAVAGHAPVTRTAPPQAQAPEPVEIPPEAEAAVATANPVPAAAPAEPEPAQPSPPVRTMPVPILEAVRSVTLNAAAAPEPQPNPQQVTRPLTPGFKPSHSDAPPMKVTELPVERQQADPWAMRAEVPLSSKQPWPVTASSLTQAMPR